VRPARYFPWHKQIIQAPIGVRYPDGHKCKILRNGVGLTRVLPVHKLATKIAEFCGDRLLLARSVNFIT